MILFDFFKTNLTCRNKVLVKAVRGKLLSNHKGEHKEGGLLRRGC